MIIRKATIKDTEKLADLYHEFYSTHKNMGKFWLPSWAPKDAKNFGDFVKAKEVKKHLVGEAIDAVTKYKSTFLFVAEENKQVVGFVSFYIEKNISWFRVKKYGFIDECCVLKKFRGKGIARELIEFAESNLKKKGIDYVMLKTSIGNKNSQQTWEHLGYKKELYVQIKELK
ncbi:MAG: GNAT family N-acetyltransferase [archaeon]